MQIEIRPEYPNDYPAVYNVNLKVFNQDYEPNLVEAIRKSANYIPRLSLVAVIDNTVVGHIMFSTLAIEADNGDIPVLGLAPVDYQNCGIGSKLIEHGLKKCKRLRFKIVVLLCLFVTGSFLI